MTLPASLSLYAPAAAGTAMLVLAGWLLWLSPERRAARAFALLLTIRGASLAALTITVTTTSLSVARLSSILYPALCLVAVGAVLYFVAVYPAPRTWLPRGPLGPAVFFGPPVALAGLALVEPGLVTRGGPLSDVGLEAVIAWLMGSARGPVGVAPTLFDLAMLLPALVLVREHLESEPGRKRTTLLLVSLGFFAPAACSCLVAGALLQLRGDVPRPPDPSIFNYVEMAIFGAWLLTMVALLVYLAARAIRTPEPAKRRSAAIFALVVIVSTLVGGATALFSDPLETAASILAMVAFWSTLGASVVTYGVVRHALFDIDIRFKRTLERGTITAAFVAVYFVVSEVAAQLFSDFSGSAYLGIGAAALLLLAIRPLEKLATAVAGRAMPEVKPLSDLDREERTEFYREQLELMWMDGVLSARDRLVLSSLRARLGLEADVAERIELEVVSSGPVAPGPPETVSV